MRLMLIHKNIKMLVAKVLKKSIILFLLLVDSRSFFVSIKNFLYAIAMIIFPLMMSVQAAQPSNDFCSKIPGHWHGMYTIKNQEHCKLYNGCSHLVMADVSHVSGNEYHVNLNPAVGQGGEFNIKCENGVITSPVNPGNQISLSCNAMNHCFITYDDAGLTSEMMKG